MTDTPLAKRVGKLWTETQPITNNVHCSIVPVVFTRNS
jgi:hypothetical protein